VVERSRHHSLRICSRPPTDNPILSKVILANPEATKKNVRFVGQDMNRSFALKENQEGDEDKFKLAAM
jgi:succinylglutamate desuccinylase